MWCAEAGCLGGSKAAVGGGQLYNPLHCCGFLHLALWHWGHGRVTGPREVVGVVREGTRTFHQSFLHHTGRIELQWRQVWLHVVSVALKQQHLAAWRAAVACLPAQKGALQTRMCMRRSAPMLCHFLVFHAPHCFFPSHKEGLLLPIMHMPLVHRAWPPTWSSSASPSRGSSSCPMTRCWRSCLRPRTPPGCSRICASASRVSTN